VPDLGCQGAQGFYFDRPEPASEATQMLTERASANLNRRLHAVLLERPGDARGEATGERDEPLGVRVEEL
jgi:hypothetical protein